MMALNGLGILKITLNNIIMSLFIVQNSLGVSGGGGGGSTGIAALTNIVRHVDFSNSSTRFQDLAGTIK